jgi:GH15 family glucan-1,4-alpha-glucosidase
LRRYPEIADHGLIGDLQTAALVASDGTLDWYCCPRFDSPSVFASLLDADRGGCFRIAPDQNTFVSRQLYLPDSAILITRFMTPGGVGEVHDFMPVTGRQVTGRHQIVRVLRAARGTVRFTMDLQPRFDYGRGEHTIELTGNGAVFRSSTLDLTLHTVRHDSLTLGQCDNGVRATWTLREGDTAGVVLESRAVEPRQLAVAEVTELTSQTARFWQRWVRRSSYTGRWRDMVTRSALTLKLLTYLPTGAPVAAATMGLPEQVGGERNRDHRYTWLRDGSFSVCALLGLGYLEEAAAFGSWLKDRAAEGLGPPGAFGAFGAPGAPGEPGHGANPMRIVYRVDGSSDLTEETLGHLEGWRGSRPVRLGSGAADQLQFDVYGEVLDAIYLADTQGLSIEHNGWLALAKLTDWLCEHWDQPEEGIWESRGGRKDFTYGRFQCWVALDRAVRLARRYGRPANLARWETERDLIYAQVMHLGWNAARRAFTQCYGTDVLDASLLLMPSQGFVAPRDPRWLSTLAAMGRELVSDSLVYRYNPSLSPDGLPGDEGTFSVYTFWYVDALARAGRLEEAALTFAKMHTYANHVGLYSEQIGSAGEQLGNFPQAFSHLALINAAVNLDFRLDHGRRLNDSPLADHLAGEYPAIEEEASEAN